VLVLEGKPDGGDFFRGAFGEVGKGAVLDLPSLAVGLAQEDAGVNLAADANLAGVEIHYEHACKRINTGV